MLSVLARFHCGIHLPVIKDAVFFQVVLTGTVSVGCGAAKYFIHDRHALSVACLYRVTGGTTEIPPLKDGEHYPTDFRVLEEYEENDTMQVQGCPAR